MGTSLGTDVRCGYGPFSARVHGVYLGRMSLGCCRCVKKGRGRGGGRVPDKKFMFPRGSDKSDGHTPTGVRFRRAPLLPVCRDSAGRPRTADPDVSGEGRPRDPVGSLDRDPVLSLSFTKGSSLPVRSSKVAGLYFATGPPRDPFWFCPGTLVRHGQWRVLSVRKDPPKSDLLGTLLETRLF